MTKESCCPLCGKKRFETVEVLPRYKLLKCRFCSFVFDPSSPKDLTSQYKKDYYVNDNPKGGYANYFQGAGENKKTFLARLKRAKRKLGFAGNLLDVGCALGDCLLQAKKLGWRNTLGIDPSAYAVEEARKRGLTVRKGTLKTLKLKPNSFDLVLSQDQIEHVTDPVEELKRMFRVIKPSCHLLVITPNVGGSLEMVLGKWWYHYKQGEHVSYFSFSTLKIALEQAGFTSIKITPTSHIMSIGYILNRMKYYSPHFFGWLISMARKLEFDKLTLRVYTGEMEAWAKK